MLGIVLQAGWTKVWDSGVVLLLHGDRKQITSLLAEDSKETNPSLMVTGGVRV